METGYTSRWFLANNCNYKSLYMCAQLLTSMFFYYACFYYIYYLSCSLLITFDMLFFSFFSFHKERWWRSTTRLCINLCKRVKKRQIESSSHQQERKLSFIVVCSLYVFFSFLLLGDNSERIVMRLNEDKGEKHNLITIHIWLINNILLQRKI